MRVIVLHKADDVLAGTRIEATLRTIAPAGVKIDRQHLRMSNVRQLDNDDSLVVVLSEVSTHDPGARYLESESRLRSGLVVPVWIGAEAPPSQLGTRVSGPFCGTCERRVWQVVVSESEHCGSVLPW